MKAKFGRTFSEFMIPALLTGLSALIFIGCSQAPTEEIAAAEAALLSARDAGAAEFAPGEYASAEEMMSRARTANDEGRYDDARASAISARDMADRARSIAMERRAEREAADREAAEVRTARVGSGSLGTGDMVSGLVTINFDFDSAVLTRRAKELLRANYEWLRSRPSVQITIEGHCDERGSAEYNVALGERRAKAAKQYLTDLGISASKIRTVSFGEEAPIAIGHNEAAWSQNRRAGFVVDSDRLAAE